VYRSVTAVIHGCVSSKFGWATFRVTRYSCLFIFFSPFPFFECFFSVFFGFFLPSIKTNFDLSWAVFRGQRGLDSGCYI